MDTSLCVLLKKYDYSNLKIIQDGLKIVSLDDKQLLLKSLDTKIINISKDYIDIFLEDKKDIDSINNIDKALVSLLFEQSRELLNEEYTKEEVEEELFKKSLKKKQNILHVKTDDILRVYDPEKREISCDRLVPDVIMRCVLCPEKIYFHKKIRAQVLWKLDHCMIVDEPFSTECLIDVDEDSS